MLPAAAPVATEAQVRQFSGRQIGDKLATLRSELIACGRELRWTQALMEGSFFVDVTLRMLDRLTCRIGVIGQVKAGKSSLINALAGKPGLLPTDVNPWTTAVTRIHFGRADAPADVAAEFSFFERNEEQLANGGGRCASHAEPGARLQVEPLHKQVDAASSLGIAVALRRLRSATSTCFRVVGRGASALRQPALTPRRAERRRPMSSRPRISISAEPISLDDHRYAGDQRSILVRDEIALRALESVMSISWC